MAKSLIIAEKPSVAADIARAIGGFARQDDYFESDRYVLSSAIGHLLEIGMPEDEEVKRGKWTFAHLPAIPSKFALKPIEKSESRLRLLLKLLKRKDVTELINACDAGREGELIFRIHRSVRQDRETDQAAVAAIDDAGRDPRRVRPSAQRRNHAPARGRRGLPVGIRLAGRYQRYAGDDRVQLEVGRLPADDRGPCPDADPRDPRRARRKNPRFKPRDYWEMLGTFVPPAARTTGAGSTKPSRRSTTIRTRARSGCGMRPKRRRSRPNAKASRARYRRRPSRRRRSPRCSTISPASSARRTAASACRRARRSRSRRRCTKSTRC